MPLPFTLGYDFSGTIHEIDDADATKFPIGTNVFGVQYGDKVSMTKMTNHVVEHSPNMLQYPQLD